RTPRDGSGDGVLGSDGGRRGSVPDSPETHLRVGRETVDREFILRKLSGLMCWDEARDDLEFPWLRLMSRLKYDGYQDFPPGARFIESLVDWLQQFKEEDRETAYDFMRKRLVYIGPGEMQHLVELFYPEEVQPRLVSAVASDLSVPSYRLWVVSE